MSTDKGFIKLYRDIRDHWVWSDPEYLKAWIDILMLVNHEDKQILFDKKLVVVKRGSRITSTRKLSERWGWSRGRVSRFLNMLEDDGMIATKRDTQKTLINVINYSNYQSRDSQKKPRSKPLTEPRVEPRTEPRVEHKQETIEETRKNEKEEPVGHNPWDDEMTPEELEEWMKT